MGIRSYQMGKALVRNKHQVVIVCGGYVGAHTGLKSEFKNGVRRGFFEDLEIIEFDISYSNSDNFIKRFRKFFLFAYRSVKLVFKENYDLIFATSTPLTAGIPGIFGRWFRRKFFVFEVRDLWPELPKAMGVINNPLLLGLMSLLEWASYKSAHRLVGLSPGICEGIISRGIPKSRVSLIPNGCDFESFDNVSSKETNLEEINKHDFIAVFTGTHGQANGLNAVLDAAAKLKELGEEEIKLLLIGDGKLKSDLRNRAELESLDNVIFKDPVPKYELARILKRSDLGMQILANVPAFYYGTSPNKFFDYIAAGLPVLNNYPGWLAELISIHDCGYAIEPDNPQLFANALVNAKNNKSKLQILGKNAKSLAKSDFDRSILSSNWVQWVIEGIK